MKMWVSLYEAGVTDKLQFKFLLLVYCDRIASHEATVEHATGSRKLVVVQPIPIGTRFFP